MATIMRARFTFSTGAIGAGLGLFQTYWRPGTSPGSNADATDILARVRAMLAATLTQRNSGCTYFANASVDALDDATGAITGSFTGTLPANSTGTGGLNPMPPQTAYLLKARTNLIVGPRLLKGRSFFGVPDESNNAPAGTPGTADVTAVTNAFNGMLTGGVTASFPVIWHRPNPDAAVPVGTSGPITSFQCEPNYWGSQRNRRF